MTSLVDTILNNITKYDNLWCKLLGIKNPYIDNYEYQLSKNIPMFDITAYKKYPKLNHLYDKLWIAKSQNIKCGMLSELKDKNEDELPKYPFFIKPRYGHKNAGSKGCHVIENYNNLMYYIDYEDSMWCEYINEKESMTDFVIYEGKVVYQLTCEYTKGDNPISDEWKYISCNNKPSIKIERWLLDNVINYNGIVNIQSRGNKIIEVSLRPARGGIYLKETQNKNIIQNINNIYNNEKWEDLKYQDIKFAPFYAFKAKSITTPFVMLPYFVIVLILSYCNVNRFHEYYFEPIDYNVHMFYQFIHHDFEEGKKCKSYIETFNYLLHTIFFILILGIIYYRLFKNEWNYILLLMFTIITILKYYNTLTSQYGLWKIQKINLGIHT